MHLIDQNRRVLSIPKSSCNRFYKPTSYVLLDKIRRGLDRQNIYFGTCLDNSTKQTCLMHDYIYFGRRDLTIDNISITQTRAKRFLADRFPKRDVSFMLLK